MRLLAVGDLHGDLGAVSAALARFRPDALLGVGDWGDDGEVSASHLAQILGQVPSATIFGNHDPLDLLREIEGGDGRPALLAPGEVRDVLGVRVAGIGGIWAKSHRKSFYVTDEDVAEQARLIAGRGPVDLLLTHGCPIGLADQTPRGTRGGQRCFLVANQAVAPRVHLCGHLHLAQERTLRDGRRVLNVGPTPDGCVVLIEVADARVEAHPANFNDRGAPPP